MKELRENKVGDHCYSASSGSTGLYYADTNDSNGFTGNSISSRSLLTSSLISNILSGGH